MKNAWIILLVWSVLLAACDDENPAAALLGGGPGSSTRADMVTSDGSLPAGYTAGQSFQTMSSEFGAVDDPNPATNPLGINGGGDPGNGGGVDGWRTGAGGQNIGSVNSTGISLPAATEIAIYGSTASAQNQPVQVTDLDTGVTLDTTIVDIGPGTSRVAAGYGADTTYGTARQLGMPVNGSANLKITPLTNSSFK